jgi:archaemetzincin
METPTRDLSKPKLIPTKHLVLFLLITCFSCRQKPAESLPHGNDSTRIATLAAFDESLSEPQSGDWLDVHDEPGQSFEKYVAGKPVHPDSKRKYIYLRPIGEFSDLQLKIVSHTAEYLQIFFGLETIVEEPVSDESIPSSARRMFDEGHEQLLTSYLFNQFLLPSIPDDAVVVMAITAKDLYPSASYNFVFGQARLKDRVGVSSLFRYTDTPLDSSNFNQCLERMIKTSSHEIGHMFSCHHCTHAVCVMNGSNSLWESDSRPNRLCSECLHKLHWNLGFDIKKRLEGIQNFFTEHHLTRDKAMISRDLRLIQ